MMNKSFSFGALLLLLVGAAGQAAATPTTTVWAPSTPATQGFLVGHLTYDTYFWKGPYSGTAGSPVYPIDTGLTIGVLPFEKVNLEVGFDLFLPSEDPLYLNAKLAIPEGAFSAVQPGVAVGIFGAGTKRSGTGQTGYDLAYAVVGKTIPRLGGSVTLGGYYSLSDELLTGADGELHRAGLIAGVTAPDLRVDKPWLQKIVLAADVQTGENSFGAAGLAASFYFTSTASILTGPVYFFEPDLQPGGTRWMWTVQLDVDMDFDAELALPLAEAPAPVAPEASTTTTAASQASNR